MMVMTETQQMCIVNSLCRVTWRDTATRKSGSIVLTNRRS